MNEEITNKLNYIDDELVKLQNAKAMKYLCNVESYIDYLEKENQQLKERINKIEKHVNSLSSVGRGCEIYADVKREILKVVRGDNK